jgi:hypothetical protein
MRDFQLQPGVGRADTCGFLRDGGGQFPTIRAEQKARGAPH